MERDKITHKGHKMERDKITYKGREEWHNKGVALFGEKIADWVFECPYCHRNTTVQEIIDAGGEDNDAFQDCIGRHTGGRQGPHRCDWAAYGLFKIDDVVEVELESGEKKEVHVFPFGKLNNE